jgi:membrane protein YdbS with pleckstrin-like domain
MNYEKLDPKAVVAWRIGRIIGFIIMGIIVCIIIVLTAAFAPNEQENFIKILYILLGLLMVYLLVGIVVYPLIEYRQWRYTITEDKVEMQHGIFFITTTVIPIVRVQHISISRGPIYQKLGLSKVKIFLASGSFEIEGLSENTAAIISENLKTRVMERLNSGRKEEK